MTVTEQIIVVGTDGSPGARLAVEWAAAEARRRGATLLVLHAFDAEWITDRDLPEPGFLDIARNHAEEVAANAELRPRTAAPAVKIRRAAVRDEPVPEILRAGETAALVVVGNRNMAGKEHIAAERQTLGELPDSWRDKYPQVEVGEVISRRGAAHALVDASQTARLVVVGSRGLGSLTGTMLGSVGLQLLHHADCPVMIARH